MPDHTLRPLEQDPEAHAGCASFETTLSLMDGLLDGAPKEEALRHAAGCQLCGPMVAHWQPLSRAFVDAFEDAAEAAKPELAGLADRVLAEVYAPAAAPRTDGPFARFLAFARGAQPWLLLGATAAALALFIPSLLSDPSPTPDPVAVVPPPVDAAAPPPVVVVRDLDFGEDSNGMVYRTPRGGMTVIWVTENEGA